MIWVFRPPLAKFVAIQAFDSLIFHFVSEFMIRGRFLIPELNLVIKIVYLL